MTLQIAAVSVQADPPLLQIAEVTVQATQADPPLLQIAEVSVDSVPGPLANTPLLQIADVRVVAIANPGAAPTITATTQKVAGVDNSIAKGGQRVDLGITLGGGGYTSVDWVALPGSPAIVFAGTDTARSFFAPYVPDDNATIRVGVSATGPGGTSAQRVFTIALISHDDWFLDNDGAWTAALESVAL